MDKNIKNHNSRKSNEIKRLKLEKLYIESSELPSLANLARESGIGYSTVGFWAKKHNWKARRQEYWGKVNEAVMEKAVKDRVAMHEENIDLVFIQLRKSLIKALTRFDKLSETQINSAAEAAIFQKSMAKNGDTIKTLVDAFKAVIKRQLDVQEMVSAVLGKANDPQSEE